jgi:hypothetical protein
MVCMVGLLLGRSCVCSRRLGWWEEELSFRCGWDGFYIQVCLKTLHDPTFGRRRVLLGVAEWDRCLFGNEGSHNGGD